MPQNRLRNPAQWGRPYTFTTPPPERLTAETPATEEETDETPSVETINALEVKQEDTPDETGTPSSAPWLLVEAPRPAATIARPTTKATPRPRYAPYTVRDLAIPPPHGLGRSSHRPLELGDGLGEATLDPECLVCVIPAVEPRGVEAMMPLYPAVVLREAEL